MMDLVKFGKAWEINTKEDYDHAMEVLKGNEFCAMMCDEYAREKRERTEIDRQRADVRKQAEEKNLL